MEQPSPQSLASSAQSKRLTLRPEWRNNRLSFVASIKPTPDNISGVKTPAIEQSPLTEQARPQVLEPKQVEEDEKPLEFWAEFFLLKPELPRLRQLLDSTEPETLLQIQHQPQQLLLQGIATTKIDQGPSSQHALETLAVLFASILAKKYTNSSADVIEVLAGLDNVDVVFTELVATLDHLIRDGRTDALKQKAVGVALAVVSGGYHTALVTYFMQRDFFPGLMKLVQQLDDPLHATQPLILIGLLANYNKFETQNPYRIRFADFVNDGTIRRVSESVGWTSTLIRSRYIAIQDDDVLLGWSVVGTLNYIGLGSLTGAKSSNPALTEEAQRELFAQQPGPEMAVLLSVYDFVLANKLFCQRFVSSDTPEKAEATPFSLFLSSISYLFQHAYRSTRAAAYAFLASLILLILIEDSATARLLSETSAHVRLCRQRSPLLPPARSSRSYAATIIDILVDGVNHNLRKRLDAALYFQLLTVLSRLITYLGKSRTKLAYHWPELWRSLLSFVRFLNQFAEELKVLPETIRLINALVNTLAFCLTNGEAFLPDAASYDDLFYKLVESGEALTKLRDTYALAGAADDSAAINTLISVSAHYAQLIESQRVKKEHLSPGEISKIIKKGYETLNIAPREGKMEQVQVFREADYKTELKRIVRVVVADATEFASAKEP